jgi:hypothetical protein
LCSTPPGEEDDVYWPTLAVGETAETAGLVGGTAAVTLLGNWLLQKYSEWRKLNRAESQEDRDRDRREKKEDEAATVALLKETIERMERERERERADAQALRKEDRDDVHQLRNRLSVVEVKFAAAEIRTNRMRMHIRHIQSLLTREKIDFEPYSDDSATDTDIHKALEQIKADRDHPADDPAATPPPPDPPKKKREAR